MLGLINEWSRKVLRRRPADTRTDEEVLEVWLSPSRPRWEYVSMIDYGPWRLIRCHEKHDVMYFFETYDDLTDAVRDFWQFNHPRPEEHCLLVDGRDQIVLGWHDSEDHDNEFRYAWFGCAFGFQLLAAYDPINAALYERLAMKEDRCE